MGDEGSRQPARTPASTSGGKQVQHDVSPLALRPKDAAHALGISERLLWSKTKSGHVPHVRIGRSVVYPIHLLRRYLDDQAKGGAR
jgi:predicted DNA-binding transcriptional regulator AlpA